MSAPTIDEALIRRQAVAYTYLIGELQTLRIWARREKQLHVCTQIERIEYTASRLAQQPNALSIRSESA